VSLARAAYACPDLVLLDDPLSALDAGTAKLVFERLIKSPTAFFSDSAVVLVTHASHFLNRVDRLMVIVDGQNKFIGTWNELSAAKSDDPKTLTAINFIRSSVQEEHSASDETELAVIDDNLDPRSNAMKAKALMTVEEREHGLSSLSTWLLWFRHAGGILFLGTLTLLMAVDRFMYVATEYWLATWTQGAYSPIEAFGIYFAPQSDGRSAQYKYLLVYAIILVVSIISTYARYVHKREACEGFHSQYGVLTLLVRFYGFLELAALSIAVSRHLAGLPLHVLFSNSTFILENISRINHCFRSQGWLSSFSKGVHRHALSRIASTGLIF